MHRANFSSSTISKSETLPLQPAEKWTQFKWHWSLQYIHHRTKLSPIPPSSNRQTWIHFKRSFHRKSTQPLVFWYQQKLQIVPHLQARHQIGLEKPTLLKLKSIPNGPSRWRSAPKAVPEFYRLLNLSISVVVAGIYLVKLFGWLAVLKSVALVRLNDLYLWRKASAHF